MSSRTLVVEQGSQPTFGDVRVGVMRIGARDGRAVAQLAVRGPGGQEIVIVDVGQTLELAGTGRLSVDSITPGAGSERGEVQFTFEAAGD